MVAKQKLKNKQNSIKFCKNLVTIATNDETVAYVILSIFCTLFWEQHLLIIILIYTLFMLSFPNYQTVVYTLKQLHKCSSSAMKLGVIKMGPISSIL